MQVEASHLDYVSICLSPLFIITSHACLSVHLTEWLQSSRVNTPSSVAQRRLHNHHDDAPIVLCVYVLRIQTIHSLYCCSAVQLCG